MLCMCMNLMNIEPSWIQRDALYMVNYFDDFEVVRCYHPLGCKI
jgi:hypothetical protein